MGKFNSAAHITHEYADNGSLIDASFQVEPSSKLTCTSDIPLDPANAMPPTVTTHPGDVERDEVVPLLGVVRILEFSGKKPPNLVLIDAPPGITIEDKVLILAVLLHPLRYQNPS